MTDIPTETFLQTIAAAAVLAGLLIVMNTLGEAAGTALYLSGVLL